MSNIRYYKASAAKDKDIYIYSKFMREKEIM